MGNGLESGVQALGASQKRMEYIAANLANLQAPGYKRLGSFTHMIESVRQGRKSSAMETLSEIDFSQGQLDTTGNPLDVALDGDGFFTLETGSGEAYTRNGRFHLDAQGTLLNEDGFAVAWEGGQGRFQPVGDEIVVDPSGAVRQGRNDIGRLKLVDFAERTRLTIDGKGYFRASRDMQPATATAEVRGGALERSNAASIDELVAMIRVQRGFESATSLIKAIDQSYKRLNAPR
jgi:flagellar basal-body rod protein FlgF